MKQSVLRAQPSGPASSSLQVCLLADDLTGACDAAVAFAARGLRSEIVFSSGTRPEPGLAVWARSTDTRDVTVTNAEARLTLEFDLLPSANTLFKKIDSVFRGNTSVEIAVTLRRFPERLGIVAPAFPALGRTSRDGVVRVEDFRGEHHICVVDELRSHGCSLPLLETGLGHEMIVRRLRQHRRKGQHAVFCDAETQADLDVLANAVQSLEEPVLWIGAGGLAHALASTLCPMPAAPVPPAPRSGNLLFFLGSNHAVTLRQVRALREHARHSQARRSAAKTVAIVEIVRGQTTPDEVRAHVAAQESERTGCLLMTGGDTAALVCHALGIQSIRLVREFAPGLPEGIACGGRFDGVPVILKSGGFGDEDVLCRIAQAFDSTAFPGRQSAAAGLQGASL